MSSDKRELLALLSQAEELALKLEKELIADESFRTDVVKRAGTVSSSARTPIDRFWEMQSATYVVPTIVTALDAGWLLALSKADDSGMTVEELAGDCGTELDVTLRLMRLLAAVDVVRELRSACFAATPFSNLMCADEALAAGLRWSAGTHSIVSAKMPEYFAARQYQAPRGPEDSVYAQAFGAPVWQSFEQRPGVGSTFNTFMAGIQAQRKFWADVYPVHMLVVSSKSDVALVDVGGGKGHELARLAKSPRWSNMTGRLILQDREAVIGEVPDDESRPFQPMAHDFFAAQPTECRGARAYYMRSIFRDWPDEDCIKILRHLRHAMRPDYSKLLINEPVTPETGCSSAVAAGDVLMMSFFGGKNRTVADWKKLFATVGNLEISALYELDAGWAIIEVVRSP